MYCSVAPGVDRTERRGREAARPGGRWCRARRHGRWRVRHAAGRTGGAARRRPGWWRDAVIYEVYPRSFADANGDGIGDIAGRPRAAALSRGTSASTPSGSRPGTSRRSPTAATTWPTTGPSTPRFGTLEEAEALIAEALELGIRTIVDVVPNHVSDEHPWFQAALAAGPGSPERARFWFRPGKGPDGVGMPTAWRNNFSGTTWTRTTDRTATPGEWYLHLFSVGQPDLNWDHPDVRARARGHPPVLVRPGCGRRAHRLRGPAGQGRGAARGPRQAARPGRASQQDRDELHDIYRSWRAIADGYPGDARSSWARSGCPTSSGSRATSGRTSSTPPSTSTSWPALGRRASCARRSTARSRRTRRSARRRHGSCPTTT